MKDSGQDYYRFFGVLMANEIKMRKVKEKIRKDLIRSNMLLESKLNRRNIIKALNT